MAIKNKTTASITSVAISHWRRLKQDTRVTGTGDRAVDRHGRPDTAALFPTRHLIYRTGPRSQKQRVVCYKKQQNNILKLV